MKALRNTFSNSFVWFLAILFRISSHQSRFGSSTCFPSSSARTYVCTYVRLYFPLYSCLRDFRHLACPFVPRASKFLFHSFPSRRYHNSQPLFSAGMGASPASSCIYLLGCCHVKHSAQKFKCGSSQPLWPPFLFISPANFTLVRLAKKFCLFIFFFFLQRYLAPTAHNVRSVKHQLSVAGNTKAHLFDESKIGLEAKLCSGEWVG